MKQLIDRLKVQIQDIRFWIVILFIIRLYGITNPPLEAASTWRQTDVLMIARNFYETDSNILYPRTDSAGELSGIVGVEFPIFNYLIFLVSKVFGFESWYGRLINLIITSIGTLYFYKLIRNYFGESPAFYSAITLLVSMWFSYSRITIPDVFAASLCIISLYQGFKYLETGNPSNLFIFVVLGMLGCLAKISAAPILTCLAIPLFINRITLSRKIIISLCSSMILGSVYYWYFVWVPHLNLTYQFGGYFFMGLPVNLGFEQIVNEWVPTLKQFFITPLKYSGLVAILLSIFLLVRNKHWIGIVSFSIPTMAFLVFIIKSGSWFAVNGYYPLVSIPFFAFLVGLGLTQLKSKQVALILSVIICAEGIGDQIHMFTIRQPFVSLLSLEETLNRFSNKNDLVAINSDGSPTPMYCAHRRGWNASNQQLLDTGFISSLKSKGCKFVIILKIFNSNINPELPKIYDSQEYSIYKL